jgi:hypothetical protein
VHRYRRWQSAGRRESRPCLGIWNGVDHSPELAALPPYARKSKVESRKSKVADRSSKNATEQANVLVRQFAKHRATPASTMGSRRATTLVRPAEVVLVKGQVNVHTFLLILKANFAPLCSTATTLVFNHITQLHIKHSTAMSQFKELEGYGPKASLDWAAIFDSVPFDDPAGRFTEIRAIIIDAAADLDIDLQLRQEEALFQPGSKAKSKSPISRHKWKQRARALALQKKTEATRCLQDRRSSLQYDEQAAPY